MNTLESRIINNQIIGLVRTKDMFFIFREVRPVFGLLDGQYTFVFKTRLSPKFGRCWRLERYLDENGTIYEHLPRVDHIELKEAQILIHKGNKPEDSAGCWLPGLTLHNSLNSIEVRRSTEAFNELMKSNRESDIILKLNCNYKNEMYE